ncbi:MAG: hypothetical protein AB7G28_13675 [Pirellulales bacterium]
MSAGSYQDILTRVRTELTAEEVRRLAHELSADTARANGASLGSRSLFDALNERGLIGFMDDAPSDLSTNPQHLEGFGQHAE